MKKIIVLLLFIVGAFYAHSQTVLDSIYQSARNYNNTNIVANSQLKAFTLNNLVNKVLANIKHIDTAGRFKADSIAKKVLKDSVRKFFLTSSLGTYPLAYRKNDTTWHTVSIAPGTNITFAKTVDVNGDTVITVNSSGGGGMAIGGTVTGANEFNVFYAGASGVLAQSADLRFNNSTKRLLISDGLNELHIEGARAITPYYNGSVANLDIGANKVVVNGLQINSPASGTVANLAAFDAGGNLISAPTTTLASGTYTPTFTNVANASGFSGSTSHWIRIGNNVTVTGEFTFVPIAATTSTSIEMTLPIATAVHNYGDVAGNFCQTTSPFLYGAIARNGSTSTVVRFNCQSITTTSTSVVYSFTYKIN